MNDNVAPFPQKPTDDYTSLMALLHCDDCHQEWFGIYENGVDIGKLDCFFCGGDNLSSRQGERQVAFYDYR